MPQMSPLKWLILYMFFLMILLLINLILNYLYIPMFKNMKVKNFKKINYKWNW